MAIGVSCAGLVIVFYSLIGTICSLAFFSLGIIALIFILPYYNIDSSFTHDLSSFPMLLWTLIGISGISSFMSIIFCCCSIRLKQCGIACVALFVTAGLIGQQVVIYQCYRGSGDSLQQINHNLIISLPQYNNNNTDATHVWDAMQTNLKCCGIKGYDDWNVIFENSTLPSSCCPANDESTFQCTKFTAGVSSEGCEDKIADEFHDKTNIMYSIALTIAVIEGIAAIVCLCACCLFKRSRAIIQT